MIALVTLVLLLLDHYHFQYSVLEFTDDVDAADGCDEENEDTKSNGTVPI